MAIHVTEFRHDEIAIYTTIAVVLQKMSKEGDRQARRDVVDRSEDLTAGVEQHSTNTAKVSLGAS